MGRDVGDGVGRGGRRSGSGVTAPVVGATASEEAVARALPVARIVLCDRLRAWFRKILFFARVYLCECQCAPVPCPVSVVRGGVLL